MRWSKSVFAAVFRQWVVLLNALKVWKNQARLRHPSSSVEVCRFHPKVSCYLSSDLSNSLEFKDNDKLFVRERTIHWQSGSVENLASVTHTITSSSRATRRRCQSCEIRVQLCVNQLLSGRTRDASRCVAYLSGATAASCSCFLLDVACRRMPNRCCCLQTQKSYRSRARAVVRVANRAEIAFACDHAMLCVRPCDAFTRQLSQHWLLTLLSKVSSPET